MTKALIIVDVQNDFCPGGSLAVPNGDEVVPVINELMKDFEIIVATQDWHPENHVSFDKWPPHCVQNTRGAELHPDLDASKITKYVQKGDCRLMEAYSGFANPALPWYLNQNEVTDVYVCGLATDYCVRATCLDAELLGYKTFLVEKACRGISNDPAILEEIKSQGIKIV